MIEHNSIYSYKFYSCMLTNRKYESIASVVADMLKFKNLLSKELFDNYFDELTKVSYFSNCSVTIMSRQFRNKMKSLYTEDYLKSINLNLSKNLVRDTYEYVYKDYVRRFKDLKRKLSFTYKGEFDHFEFYKRDTKNHKKGDFKSIIYRIHKDENGKPIHKFSIKLALVLTFLCRHGKSNILDEIRINYDKSKKETKLLFNDVIYICQKVGLIALKKILRNNLFDNRNQELKVVLDCISNNKDLNIDKILVDKDKEEIYSTILKYCEQYGLKRLLRIAISKRNRKYSKQITYKSFSFNGFSGFKQILGLNKNKNSKIDAFAQISWLERGKALFVPVKYSKKFFGNINDFNKHREYRYILKLDELNKRVVLILTQEKERKYTDANLNYDDVVGVDVNFKHNMLTAYDGENFIEFDYDRDLLREYAKELKKN